MSQEIERKFLIANDRWRKDVSAVRHIRQGYLAFGSRAHVRVRIVDEKAAVLTIKSREGELSRREFEYPIPVNEAKELMALAEGAIIEKRRHCLEADGLKWEIDVFEGDNAGLVIAEIELGKERQEFSRPLWLGKEVTGQARYYNSSLAQRPLRR